MLHLEGGERKIFAKVFLSPLNDVSADICLSHFSKAFEMEDNIYPNICYTTK